MALKMEEQFERSGFLFAQTHCCYIHWWTIVSDALDLLQANITSREVCSWQLKEK